MRPRIIGKINRQMVPPIMAILALEGHEGHPSGARAHTPRSRDARPDPTLPGLGAVALGLIVSSASLWLCDLGHTAHLSGPPLPRL